jgi:hypothetical protein
MLRRSAFAPSRHPAPVAQWIECSPPEREVAGSNPAGRAPKVLQTRRFCAHADSAAPQRRLEAACPSRAMRPRAWCPAARLTRGDLAERIASGRWSGSTAMSSSVPHRDAKAGRGVWLPVPPSVPRRSERRLVAPRSDLVMRLQQLRELQLQLLQLLEELELEGAEGGELLRVRLPSCLAEVLRRELLRQRLDLGLGARELLLDLRRDVRG